LVVTEKTKNVYVGTGFISPFTTSEELKWHRAIYEKKQCFKISLHIQSKVDAEKQEPNDCLEQKNLRASYQYRIK